MGLSQADQLPGAPGGIFSEAEILSADYHLCPEQIPQDPCGKILPRQRSDLREQGTVDQLHALCRQQLLLLGIRIQKLYLPMLLVGYGGGGKGEHCRQKPLRLVGGGGMQHRPVPQMHPVKQAQCHSGGSGGFSLRQYDHDASSPAVRFLSTRSKPSSVLPMPKKQPVSP